MKSDMTNDVVVLNRKIEAAALNLEQLQARIIDKIKFLVIDSERLSLAIKLNSDVVESKNSLKMLVNDVNVIHTFCEEFYSKLNGFSKSGSLSNLPSTLTGIDEAGEHVDDDLGMV